MQDHPGLDVSSTTDIYSIYSVCRQRVLLLLIAAVYLLLPLSDTILLPKLSAIEADMQASNAVSTANMSLYLFACGVGFLVWGPAADALGRLPVYHITLIAFLATSIGCALAPNIAALLACRALQGLTASSTWALGNAVVADIFDPRQRGMAYGVFMLPGQVGTIVAPFLGAALAQGFGWRSTMWFLVILAGVAELAVAVLYRETQQHRVISRIQQQCKAAGVPMPDWAAELQLQQRPQQLLSQFKAMAQHLTRCVWDVRVLPYLLLAVHAFACMFLLLIQLPERLSSSGLSHFMVGVSYLGTGACSVIGSLLGGWVADKAAAANNAPATARLELGSITTFALVPAGLLLLGWTEVSTSSSAPVVGSLLGAAAVCFASSLLGPGVFSYLSGKAQAYAGAAGSLVAAGMNIWAAVLAQINPAAGATIRIRLYNTILAASVVVLAGVCVAVCLWQRRLGSTSSGENHADSGGEQQV